MARFTFRLPDIGEGISEAEIVAWHVKLGDRVEEDQSVADMMTDKATVEMESPVSGTIVELAGEVGDQVPIGSALMVIETDAVEEAASPATEEAVLEAENPGVEEAQPPSLRGEGMPQAETSDGSPVAAPHPTLSPEEREQEKKVLASPAVRARALDLGVDLASVKPAEGDRVRHSDLDAFLRYGSGQGYTPARAPAPTKPCASSACAAASPRTWPRPSAPFRTSPMSRKSTSPRWRRRARSSTPGEAIGRS
ncbi:hypothetical protein GCM10020258_12910 [Sphingomonas yabuuchiae]